MDEWDGRQVMMEDDREYTKTTECTHNKRLPVCTIDNCKCAGVRTIDDFDDRQAIFMTDDDDDDDYDRQYFVDGRIQRWTLPTMDDFDDGLFRRRTILTTDDFDV